MTELALILVSTVLVNNFVLVKFLGLCPFMGVSRSVDTATGMALATTFVLTLASGLSYLLHRYVLVPTGTEYLKILAFILIIAGSVQLVELYIRRSNPMLHQVLGVFLPLITSNCAVLGIALLNIQESHSLVEALAFGLGGGLGFSLVIILFAGLRERTEAADVPDSFRGAAISLVTAAFMALAFMGFTGLTSG